MKLIRKIPANAIKTKLDLAIAAWGANGDRVQVQRWADGKEVIEVLKND